MIKLENFEVMGWEHAIRGMRNPKNSWERSDSLFFDRDQGDLRNITQKTSKSNFDFTDLGPNDHELMKLDKGGPVHAKYRRMIIVYVDITAPLYWWKEFDTYKVGTVANSCSTMHKIADKEFTEEDFSIEHLPISYYDGLPTKDMIKTYPNGEMCYYSSKGVFTMTIDMLNKCRERYLETGDKKYWHQMIQLLPSSYNQKRTVMLNYEVLAGIYPMRKNHKLDEWREFCTWIESLPYSEIITGVKDKIIECAIYTDNPVFFANKLIELRDSDGIARIGEFKGVYYAACDGVTAEDIIDAINQEMEVSENDT